MRGYLLTLAVILLAGLLWAQSARPGDAPYSPTKLEWASLEMQVEYGQDFSPNKDFSMSFRPENDGRTVHCLLIYDRTVSAAQSKAVRADADACCGVCEKQGMGLAKRDLQRRSYTIELASSVRPFPKD
jgi:hypothetical protein